ncbi:hypothetical protein ACOMHN_003461 [Nucella lapillus]
MMTCVVLSEGGGGGVKLTPEAVDSYTRIVCYTCYDDVGCVLSEGGGGGKLTPEAVDYYTRIGDILAVYRRGKLPKALKTLPSFQELEQCLYKTRPDKWTAASMYAATRIFSSNLPAALAQR